MLVISRNRSNEGFSLIELMVVIAILGLLALIAVPRVVGYLDHAKLTAANSSIEGLSSALDLYKVGVGRFPTTEEGLAALMVRPASAKTWKGPYLRKKAELTDPWGNPFQYKSPGEHGVFDLYSVGPDAKDLNDMSHAITSWE